MLPREYLDVFLRVNEFRVERRVGEIAIGFQLERPRLVVNDVPMKDVEFVESHGLL